MALLSSRASVGLVHPHSKETTMTINEERLNGFGGRFGGDPGATFGAPTAVLADISGGYNIDPAHTRLGFVARHAMVTKVRGAFTEFSGTAHVDTADPGKTSVSVTIVANSITTGQQQRDDHLRSGD